MDFAAPGFLGIKFFFADPTALCRFDIAEVNELEELDEEVEEEELLGDFPDFFLTVFDIDQSAESNKCFSDFGTAPRRDNGAPGGGGGPRDAILTDKQQS